MLTLKKPHPFIFNNKSVVLPWVITFLLISIFAPFGFKELAVGDRLLFGAGIGLLSSLSIISVVSGARTLFPELMLEDNWTVGKEIVLILSVVVTICLLIFCCFVLFDLSSSSLLIVFKQVVLYTTVISTIPITILVLYEQYSFQKQSAKQAIALTQDLKDANATPADKVRKTDFVLFEAENGKVELQIPHDKVLYLKAEGNYVEVFYMDKHNHAQKKLMRNRLKSFLEILPPQQFFHAHKSYVVNGSQIERVEGNARNFELVMYATDVRLPVSRSKSTELSAFLKSLH